MINAWSQGLLYLSRTWNKMKVSIFISFYFMKPLAFTPRRLQGHAAKQNNGVEKLRFKTRGGPLRMGQVLGWWWSVAGWGRKSEQETIAQNLLPWRQTSALAHQRSSEWWVVGDYCSHPGSPRKPNQQQPEPMHKASIQKPGSSTQTQSWLHHLLTHGPDQVI